MFGISERLAVRMRLSHSATGVSAKTRYSSLHTCIAKIQNYTPGMSAGMNATVQNLATQFRVEAGVQLSPQRVTKELLALQKQLREVEYDIVAVRQTLHGLSLILGEEYFSEELLRLIRPKRTNIRGLSSVCRSLLLNAPYAYSVREVCNRINATDPLLLTHHRNPMASVMSVLRQLARRGEIIRKTENGKSVWQQASSRFLT
jgi:hypothetical protein